MKLQPAAGDGGSSSKVENEETAVPVLKLYSLKMKIQPAPETAVPVLELYDQRMNAHSCVEFLCRRNVEVGVKPHARKTAQGRAQGLPNTGASVL